MYTYKYFKLLIFFIFQFFYLSVYACTEGPSVTVNCYDFESAEDLADALEEALPISQYSNVRFTLSQLRVIIFDRVLGRYIPVGGGPIPLDKSCGQDWDEVAQNLDLDWDTIDQLTSGTGGGSPPDLPPLGGTGGDGGFDCLITETIVGYVTSCDANGNNCITTTTVYRYTTMSPACIG